VWECPVPLFGTFACQPNAALSQPFALESARRALRHECQATNWFAAGGLRFCISDVVDFRRPPSLPPPHWAWIGISRLGNHNCLFARFVHRNGGKRQRPWGKHCARSLGKFPFLLRGYLFHFGNLGETKRQISQLAPYSARWRLVISANSR
jgi:hypothetical protein